MTAARAWLIYVTNFLLASAIGVVFVFFEDVQSEFGLGDFEVGLIAGSGFGASFVAQLVLSPLADRGRSGPLASLALACGVVGLVSFGFGTNALVLGVGRSLGGVGVGLFMLLARKALIGTDASGGGAKLGIVLSTTVAGFIVGPVIGALFEPLGFEAPFLLVSALLVVTGVPATVQIMRAEIAESPHVDHRDLLELAKRPRVQAAMLVQLVVYGLIGVFNSSIDRFLTDLGASTAMVAIVVLFVGAPLLVFPTVAGSLAERRGGASSMLLAMFVLLPAAFGYGLASSVGFVIVCGVLHGSGEAFASISAQVLVLEVTGAERAAVGSALLDASGLLAATVMAFGAPIVYGEVGQSLFTISGVGGVVLATIAALRIRRAPTERVA